MFSRSMLPWIVLSLLPACAGDKGTDPVDSADGEHEGVDSSDPGGGDSGDTGAADAETRSHFQTGVYEDSWDCLAWYSATATPLAAEEICDDCELGFEIEATLEPGYPEAHGGTSCEDGALDGTWASEDTFTTRWSFELDDTLNQMAWYEYADAWYPTAALTVGEAEDGTQTLLWGFNEEEYSELSASSEVWTFKIYSY